MELEEILDDLLPPDLCLSCVHRRFYPIQSPCFKCIEFVNGKEIPTGEFYKKIKITNADHIRAMTDEELAEWICQETTNALNLLSFGNDKPSKSFFTWLDWLQQEVDDGD